MGLVSYPIKFHPILKSKIWGGEKLKRLLHKPSEALNVGESWEISGVDENVSVVSNGDYKGSTLTQLLSAYGDDILGHRLYKQFNNTFPLLIKFIDANQDLSIQLHPNDELASKRHNSFGKTEMWYVMQADDKANLIVGFNQKMNEKTYQEHLKAKTLPQVLNYEPVKKGDTFFIEVGRIHAIGAGVMLAEIQQTSDITYRIYDWDRVDDEGKSRALHNDLAIDAIDFEMQDDYKINYKTEENTANSVVSCPYFKTSLIPLSGELRKQNNMDSFIIYICVEGDAEIKVDGKLEQLQMGETVLVPASAASIVLNSKSAKLLEVHV